MSVYHADAVTSVPPASCWEHLALPGALLKQMKCLFEAAAQKLCAALTV